VCRATFKFVIDYQMRHARKYQWIFGVIPVYEMALALSVALIAFLLWRTWPKIISLRTQALAPPAV